MDERTYQRGLIDRIYRRFPGCVIMKNDPRQQQGVPDLLILFNRTWGMLEVKMDDDSSIQPNQEYYVRQYNDMSYAAFINPGNEEDVLNDLQQTFRLAGEACISKSQ